MAQATATATASASGSLKPEEVLGRLVEMRREDKIMYCDVTDVMNAIGGRKVLIRDGSPIEEALRLLNSRMFTERVFADFCRAFERADPAAKGSGGRAGSPSRGRAGSPSRGREIGRAHV